MKVSTRPRMVVATTLLWMGALVSCDTQAQFAPSLPLVVGLQVDGATLRVLTGSTCSDVERLTLLFEGADDEQDTRVILASDPPTDVETFSVRNRVEVEGFDVIEALPSGFSWRDFSTMSVVLNGPEGLVGVADAELREAKAEGAERTGDGTAFIRGEGWLTPQEITAGDTKSFLAACTPDPAQQK